MTEAPGKTIGIIGAGITGLALAWRLRGDGREVTVLEESDTPGGALRSHREGPYIAEEGPHSLLIGNRDVDAFIQSVPGLAARVADAKPEAKKRFIVRGGKIHPVPMGPLSALTTPLWSLSGKLRVLGEPFVGRAPAEAEESVADFVRRRLGPELLRYAINPLVGGIYAGDPKRLSLRHGFPKLHELEQEHGGLIRGAVAKMREARMERKRTGTAFRKRMISFRAGMGELPGLLAAALGENLRTRVSIESIRQAGEAWEVSWRVAEGVRTARFDRLALTVPTHRLRALPLPETVRAALGPLESIEYPPVSVLSLAFRRADVAHPLDGFGALVPECEGCRILGVLFPSSLFPDRAPRDEVLLAVFTGGTRQPEEAMADAGALQERVMPELRELLGVTGEPVFRHHRHWPQAIPQYTLGYGAKLDAIRAIESAHPGLHLRGNYRSGISVSYCLEAALEDEL